MIIPDWINDPWFVGIGGGVLSGIAATWLSRLIFSKRDSKEYAQKVASVSREIIYSVRPGISEGSVPEKKVLESLISATARKYTVAEADVLKVHQIADELIKEVMDSSFISSATKSEYCSRLMALKEDDAKPPASGSTSFSPGAKVEVERIRSNMLTQMSLMMGVMVSTMSMLLTFYKSRSEVNSTFSEYGIPVAVLLAAIASMMVVVAFRSVTRERRRRIESEITHAVWFDDAAWKTGETKPRKKG